MLCQLIFKPNSKYRQEKLTQDEAMQVIEKSRHKDIQYTLKGSKSVVDIIDRCGRLPLAIAITGGLNLKSDEDWQGAMEVILKQKSELNPHDGYNANLFHVLELSIKQLGQNDADLFRLLGVFKAVKIPLQSIVSLWQRENQLMAKLLLRELNRKSLLTFEDRER